MKREIRRVELTEIRAEELDGKRVLRGLAAPFDAETVVGGMFREVVRKGAFKKTIKEFDQRALWNHDSGKPLGRRSVGSLRVSETDQGLAVEVDVPDTSWGRDAYESVRTGLVNGMSFGFDVVKQAWRKAEDGMLELREILEAKLWEVSFVTFPQYEQTEAEARGILDGSAEFRGQGAESTEDGKPPLADDHTTNETQEPEPVGHSGAEEGRTIAQAQALVRVLEKE